MMILPSISTRDLIREFQDVTACLRAQTRESRALEQPKFLPGTFISIARQRNGNRRRQGTTTKKVDGDIRRLLSYVSYLFLSKRGVDSKQYAEMRL